MNVTPGALVRTAVAPANCVPVSVTLRVVPRVNPRFAGELNVGDWAVVIVAVQSNATTTVGRTFMAIIVVARKITQNEGTWKNLGILVSFLVFRGMECIG
jgi:hypothetical protein